MIYFVTNQSQLFIDEKNESIFSSGIKLASIQDCLDYCNNLEEVGLDLETTGFDPHTDKILLFQLGDYNRQYVMDFTIDFKNFKQLVENKLILGQNLKFDLRFVYKIGIYPNKIYDTYLAETKLNQGIPDVYKNLEALNDRYVGDSTVKKSDRGSVHKGLNTTSITYAAYDVKNLGLIKKAQLEAAKKLKLETAIELENQFALTLAYTEYCGMYVDPKKWVNKVEKRKLELIKSLNELNQYILKNNISKYIEQQLDLFSNEKKIIINWNSDKQVKELFKDLGINVKIIEKGIEKESVDAKVIKPQINEFPIISLYLEYKRWEKDLSTYGEKFLKQVNKNTGRLHTSFTQIIDTGRMASGGKNKATGEEYINFQNIPADSETRSCFTNQFDNTILVNCDYSGMESVVMANVSKEPNLIEFYNQNLGDLHSFVASKLFKELGKLTLEDIKTFHKDKRQIAKSANFALSYGGTGFTIAKNLSIPKEDGDAVEKAYFDAFKELKKFFDKQEQDTLDNGYILIDQLTGSKYFIAEFEQFRQLHKKYSFDNKDFWSKWKVEKANKSIWWEYEKSEMSRYFRWKGQIRRYAQNFPIQGSSASITKIAGIHFFRWIKENNLLHKVLISNIVHDEFLIECPKDIANLVAEKVQYFMEYAGAFYCKLVKLRAEPQITTKWEH